MRKLVYCLIFLSLTGCANFLSCLKNSDAIIAEKVVQLDSSVYEPCKPLVLTQAKTFEELLDTQATNVAIYAECAGKQDTSIILLKSFANKKEPK